MDPRAFELFERLERTHWWFRGRREVYLGLLRELLAGGRPARLLDVGAGVGGFLGELSLLAAEVHYSDAEPAAVARCARRGFARGVAASADALPYAAESFDLVCLFDVLEHVEDDRRALREVRRVLSHGGLAMLSVPAHPILYGNNDVVAGHQRRYTRASLRAVLCAAGLRVERVTYSNAFLFPAIAPTVLLMKLLERTALVPADSRHTNLSLPLPRAVHALLYRVFASELTLSRRVDLPFGHSLLAVARRLELAPLDATPAPAFVADVLPV